MYFLTIFFFKANSNLKTYADDNIIHASGERLEEIFTLWFWKKLQDGFINICYTSAPV